MNFRTLICICSVIWLTACASTPLPTYDQSVSRTNQTTTKATATATATQTPAVAATTTQKAISESSSQHPDDELRLSPSRSISYQAEQKSPAGIESNPVPQTELSFGNRNVASIAPPADLWERIRRGYAMPDLDNSLVKDRERWYASRPDYIFRMTERSQKYLFHIVEELELRNMPTELALLPFVESAFNPQAISSAKAAGMWQFMPATGKHFDLKQNAFRDDRRDVLASTRAALDYLQKLYGMFGDWHLALAAYNWGEGSVQHAINKNQRKGLPTGYGDLTMPMETRFYVPKLQAIKNIVSSPETFSTNLPVIGNHPYFDTVTIKRDIDVALAARLAEVPLEDFKALNPSLNRPVILAAGTPQILLPWENADIFQNNLASYTSGRLASWTVWIAPSNMKVADAAKRVGISETELRSVNHIPPRVSIRAGSSLVVPRPNAMQEDVKVNVAENGQLTLSPEMVQKRIVVRAGKADTVNSIALKHKTNAANVAQWNKVAINARFKPGQSVILFVTVPANGKKAARHKPGHPAHSKTKSVHSTARKIRH